MKRKPTDPNAPPPQQPPPAPKGAHHHPAPAHKTAPAHKPGPINPKLFVAMERSGLHDELGGVYLSNTGGDAKTLMSQDPATIDRAVLPLVRAANQVLPLWQIDPRRQGLFKRQIASNLSTMATNVGNSLRIAGTQGISFAAQPDHLDDLMKKEGCFSSFRLIGMQLIDAGAEQRQVSGSFEVFMLDRLAGALDRFMRDPKVEQARKDKVLHDFAPALMELDDVLRNPQQRKDDLTSLRKDLGQQAQDAKADAQLAETSLRVRQKLVLPREGLFAAARRHVAKMQQQENPGVLADQPALTPAPAPADGKHTPRRIIQ